MNLLKVKVDQINCTELKIGIILGLRVSENIIQSKLAYTSKIQTRNQCGRDGCIKHKPRLLEMKNKAVN